MFIIWYNFCTMLYINDIQTGIMYSDCRLYADDTLLSCDTTNDQSLIQTDVNSLYEWACRWGMVFNPKKCVHIQIGKSVPDFNIFLGNEVIPTSDCFKYLGIHIQSNLKVNATRSGSPYIILKLLAMGKQL